MRYCLSILIICAIGLNAFSGQNSDAKDNLVNNNAATPSSDKFLFQLSTSGNNRTAFVRMEKNAQLSIDITNNTGRPLSNVIIKSKCSNDQIKTEELPTFQNQENKTINIPVDTSIKPGKYIYSITISSDTEHLQDSTQFQIPVNITKRNLPHEMPVVLWATPDFKIAKNLGFTHAFLFLPRLPDGSVKIWDAGSPIVAEDGPRLNEIYNNLNEALIDDFEVIAIILPHRYNNRLSPYHRINRLGEKYSGHGADNLCGIFKQIQKYYYNVGASIALTYGDCPALVGANINSEVRDHANLCFHPHDLKAYKIYSGQEVPENINNKYGLSYTTLENFPADHIIPDDDDILDYLKWYWQEGDGWNKLTTLVSKGLKSTGRDDLCTFTDPAIRVPSISGSGGAIDAINQWTYCLPNPIKIGKAADELLAMASLSKVPDQGVFKMTQAIWYRSSAAPKNDNVPKVEWEREKPDAAYITIPPDCLREAFWSKISRSICGVMYHGLGSIAGVGPEAGMYAYTNPNTKEVIKELADQIVKPLGPTLLQVPDINSDVAFLQSFTSQMYAGAGEYGWGGGWENDAYEILRYAHLQPKVIFDEHIVQGELDNVKVLVLINCPVLTETVARKINKFQRNGGLIISDENVCLGLSPDILMYKCIRTKDASVGKKQLQQKAQSLRKQLDKYYSRHIDSNNDDVIVRARRYHKTDYIFTINDNRTFGDYVGHHKLVMEKGLPSNALISVKRKNGHVYDLKAHKKVSAVMKNRTIEFPVELIPGGGSVFMVTNQKIDSINIITPDHAVLGNNIEIKVNILDPNSEPVKAVVPCHIKILDPQGAASEFSGYYGAKDGQVKITYNIARNDLKGQWKVIAKELASGIKQNKSFKVKRNR